MNDFEIVFYRRPSGECPVCDFLDSLNKVMRFKMMHQMDLLELYGNHPRGDYSKFVDEGIFELRAQTRTDITRIMFFFDENRKIVLTNGFIKKTQKMPMSEFELAKKYRSDYLSRKKELESSQKSSPGRLPVLSGARSWTILCLPQNLAAAPLYLAIL